MRYLIKTIATVCFLLSSIYLSSSAFARHVHQTPIQTDASPITLCTSHVANQGVTVVTFESEEECNSYVGAVVLGAAEGYAYSNCSSAAYCMTYGTPITGSLAGFSLVALSAVCVWEAALEFANSTECENALNAGNIVCSNKPICSGSVLQVSGCSNNNWGGTLTVLINSLLSFSFTGSGNCQENV